MHCRTAIAAGLCAELSGIISAIDNTLIDLRYAAPFDLVTRESDTTKGFMICHEGHNTVFC